VEILVHVGIDTVQLSGRGFTVAVVKDQRVSAGDPLVEVDLAEVEKAGFDPTTIVTVTNTFALASVTPRTADVVAAGEPVIDVRV
jgi:PTS system beta-glucosides-specific IIC component